MIWRWALREFKRDLALNLFFILNLGLGLSGFLTLSSFKQTLDSYLKNNAKKILSADLSVSARRKISETEIKNIRAILIDRTKNNFLESEIFEFFAMARDKKNQAKLILVRAIDSNYPLYGYLKLQNNFLISSDSKKEILQEASLWAYPEIKDLLGVNINDDLEIGQVQFKIDNFVLEDASQTFRLASLAPRVFIGKNYLQKTGLIQFGSTFTNAFLFKLPENTDINEVQSALFKAIPDAAVQIETAQDAGQDSARQLAYLSDFLGLSSLVALFLSSLGASYIYLLFLNKKTTTVAIYEILGLNKNKILSIFVLNLFINGILSLIPALLFSIALNPLLSRIIQMITPFPVTADIQMSSVLLCLLIGTLVCLLLGLPFIDRIKSISPGLLLRPNFSSQNLASPKWLYFIPACFFLWILSVFLSHSFKNGSLFFFSLILLSTLIVIFGWILFYFLEKIISFPFFKQVSWSFRYSFLSLTRKKVLNLLAFSTLSIGVLLINLLPQLKTSLKADLEFESESNIPSIFLFDIQEDQVDKLQQLLAENKISIQVLSPLVRARIIKINDNDYERQVSSNTYRTREEEQESRFRNRGVNLSYRKKLSSSESITKGPELSPFKQNQKIAELSLEEGFAERLKINLGDKITFDVQGVEIEGQVVNFRKVKWTSFQPNFFILFQDGFLNDAPKTFIALMSSLTDEKKNKVFSVVSSQLKNISMVDVHRIVGNTLSMINQMSLSLELMSLLAIFTGFVILYSILTSQSKQKGWETNLFKILGSKDIDLIRYLIFETLMLSLCATLTGLLFSFAFSSLLLKLIFNTLPQFDLKTSLFILILVPTIATLIGTWVGIKISKKNAIEILRQ